MPWCVRSKRCSAKARARPILAGKPRRRISARRWRKRSREHPVRRRRRKAQSIFLQIFSAHPAGDAVIADAAPAPLGRLPALFLAHGEPFLVGRLVDAAEILQLSTVRRDRAELL